MIHGVIIDGIPFSEIPTSGTTATSIKAFIQFIEKRLSGRFIVDLKTQPLGRTDILGPLRVAESLLKAGVIESFYPTSSLPDEPKIYTWLCEYAYSSKKGYAGGATASDESSALFAALAEGLERYIWYTQTDYFVSPLTCTTGEIVQQSPYIAPQTFSSFSPEQRSSARDLYLDEEAQYLWIKTISLSTRKHVYIPGQVVSAAIHTLHKQKEPLIRQQTTIGLATWPTLAGARLAGALEIIEREALMVMWFNQLTLPRINLSLLRNKKESLQALLQKCEKYRLKVHAIQMITDAPTHTICVVVEDLSIHAPRFTLGLKAHRSLTYCIEKALTEALRARHGYRSRIAKGVTWDPRTPVDKIGHHERLYFWGQPENAKSLEFLIQGEEIEYKADAVWENDSEKAHLNRVLSWCRNNSFECVSVSLGKSVANPTPWHVEMVVMPDLQPTHLHEGFRHLGGSRLKHVPQLFGYTPLATPHIATPHPYL